MVLQTRPINNMASEQPLKKKQRIEDLEGSDDTDFISSVSESGLSSLTALHLSLPANVYDNDINLYSVNHQFTDRVPCQTSDGSASKDIDSTLLSESRYVPSASGNIPSYLMNNSNMLTERISLSSHIRIMQQVPECFQAKNVDVNIETSLDEFQNNLVQQCLCGISEHIFQRPFDGYQILSPNGIRSGMLTEWSYSRILNFLSNLQLLFDIYLKQNNKGFICSKILDMCNNILMNNYNLMEQIISLCDARNIYINSISAKVVSSFFIISKNNINNEWLETIFNFLTLENIDYFKMNFALEIINKVVEWKDLDRHISKDIIKNNDRDNEQDVSCSRVPYVDSESFDTSVVKGLIIKNLVLKWQSLIAKIRFLIVNSTNVQAQTCIITFLELWENTISIKNNLSVMDTKPFYAHLEIFLALLNNTLPLVIWKQLLSLFNEVLCYGSTLALQDLLPDDTCRLGHFVIRYVKDHALLDSLPFRQNESFMVHSFVGTLPHAHLMLSNIDKTLLQKMVLLVLKSVALSIKETKSDSSDSSIGSDDSDYNQDMLVISRSMKDVLNKLDIFLKRNLEFHPETPFSKILIHLFSDQDDYLVESMVCTLDIIVGIPDRCSVFPEIFSMLNPTYSFIEFLKVVSHSSEVLLDYLVSNETCFLLYLLRFLKYIRRNWSYFSSSCQAGSVSNINEFEASMNVLISLTEQIERLVVRNLFPYNIDPVLRLLKVCCNLYESNRYS